MKPINYLLLFIFITAQTFAQTEADKAKILAATNVAELNRLAPIYDSIFKTISSQNQGKVYLNEEIEFLMNN